MASGRSRQATGGQHPRPTQPAPKTRAEGGAAVDIILEILGYILLLLAGLAVVLLAVILVLLQAQFILRLVDKLTKRLEGP
jgi:hypothetical protein